MTTTLDATVVPVTTSVDAPVPGTGTPGDEALLGRRDEARELVFELQGLEVRYHGRTAVRGVELDIAAHEITAFIGPSGCGKTTVLRSLNRMHDITPGASVHGLVSFHARTSTTRRSMSPRCDAGSGWSS